MYAVIKTGGKQYRVAKGDVVRVERLRDDVGAKVSIDSVSLVAADDQVHVGTPIVDGASVEATVVEVGRGQKLLAFKKKRRKGYRRKIGHRQAYTALQIDDIVLSGSGKLVSKKAAAKKPAAKKPAAKKPSTKKATADKPEQTAASDDNLKRIEGIGPKIESVLKDAGIMTFAALAGSDEAALRGILEAAGGRLRSHDPTTWPSQAALAAEERWDDLKELQGRLTGGKEG
ncbi:MAG TPA: 50S ribosomal protein L21 [Acidobacteriota bacterium]|nr:50S ribosomal protein L21 [Acidobacteriota bacterium]